MNRTGVLALSALCASLVSMATFGAGTAYADDYAGQKYSDVSAALSKAGQTGVIATRSGDELADSDCVVTHSEKAAWLKGDSFAPVTGTVLLFLNCNADVASATKSGNSAASPEGRAAIAKAKQDAAAAAAKQKAATAKS
ncbi:MULTISPECIES: hypothetical protein [unclassified Mycolicibacterium]|uniref:hypothetical protein n=1 Tax=unclassified Mycolicibacterium TaxID=2636767 RepID=UPI001F4C3598|nr:hypothetical protein [Mycolicibacterium sp. YH-1]UNB50964.1 hypothetical protein L0M16_23910 [Mycolicibacterium sp. YH-1]